MESKSFLYLSNKYGMVGTDIIFITKFLGIGYLVQTYVELR